MAKTTLPLLDRSNLQQIVITLTKPRLHKYLQATGHHMQQALRLYILNAKVSAAFMTDLHYIEIALRNKFDQELTPKFGAEWFRNPDFLSLLTPHSQNILIKAQKDAARHWPKGVPLPPGKVIAELTFGFWLQLTDARLEHPLWVPVLHKAFLPRKAPKRASFNLQLEKLRQLRNRTAHHEPIFHLDLIDTHRHALEVANLLCPTTAQVMRKTSVVQRSIMQLLKYRRRRSL